MFDPISERCYECDGHFTHSSDCPVGSPSALSLEARIALFSTIPWHEES